MRVVGRGLPAINFDQLTHNREKSTSMQRDRKERLWWRMIILVHLILKVSLIVAQSQAGTRQTSDTWSATQPQKLTTTGECKGTMTSHGGLTRKLQARTNSEQTTQVFKASKRFNWKHFLPDMANSGKGLLRGRGIFSKPNPCVKSDPKDLSFSYAVTPLYSGHSDSQQPLTRCIL